MTAISDEGTEVRGILTSVGLVMQIPKGNIKGEYEEQFQADVSWDPGLTTYVGLEMIPPRAHREKSLGLTVLTCKMGIAITAPLSHLGLL